MDAEDEGHVERESIFEFNKAFGKLEVFFLTIMWKKLKNKWGVYVWSIIEKERK